MASQIADRLAIHSFCFRSFTTNEQVIAALKECGVKNVELSRSHLDPAEEVDCQPVIKMYADAGIAVTTMGVIRIDADEKMARRFFEFAKLSRIETLPVTFLDGGQAVAEKLCREYNIKVGMHNHGRKHRYGSRAALEELFSESSANIGLCLDTAWMLDSGEDPVEVAERFKDRLYALHIKDFVFDRAGKPSDVIVGEGNLKLDALNSLLMEINYPGTYTLEYEGDIDNPVPATKKCVKAVRASFARLSPR